ncbi:MAG: hypothetical protein ACSHX4_08825 [Opitutaceae bacterium]
MSRKDLPPPPPPNRQPKRRLSLKTAIAAASRTNSTIVKPLMNPLGEFPEIKTGKQQEMEANLLELQADIIIREGLLSDKERLLQSHELELNEKEALLEAHRKVIDIHAAPNESASQTNSAISTEEREAFDALKRELNNQEQSLKNARKMLHEREDFIEQCENELVEKSMLLTEREARIEQREEDHEAKKFADANAAKAS